MIIHPSHHMTSPCLSEETDVPIVTFCPHLGNIKFYSPASESPFKSSYSKFTWYDGIFEELK